MSIKNYEIGDRVIGFDECNLTSCGIDGIEGTIVTIIDVPEYKYGVYFDKNINGNNLRGYCPNGYGCYVKEQEILPLTIKNTNSSKNTNLDEVIKLQKEVIELQKEVIKLQNKNKQ